MKRLDDVEVTEASGEKPASTIEEALKVERGKLLRTEIVQPTRSSLEVRERPPETCKVLWRRVGNDVHVVRSARIAVEGEREAPDQNVLDVVCPEDAKHAEEAQRRLFASFHRG